jgi:hypothetical protein
MRVLILGLCLVLAGCAGAPSGTPAPPPTPVTVSRPVEGYVTDYADFTARTAAVDSVEVRAHVWGYLDKVNFKEGVLCALAGVAFRRLDNNLFTQIGFVVLIGLACKNAILIVEFARDRQLEGAPAFEAAVQAAVVRLRPIVMTTMCFVHMVPPYLATGAGAEMRRSVGTAMLWGAFGVTLFGLFLTPVFFYVIRRFAGQPPSTGAHP